MNKRKVSISSYARKGGMLVIAVPELQRAFDNLKSGGGLILAVKGEPVIFSELLLVSQERFDEISMEIGATRH